MQQTVDALGRLDTVINNAGVMLLGPVEGAPIEDWERMVDVNVKGLLYTARAALPHLVGAAEDEPRAGRRPREHLELVAGRSARAGSGVYNLTKFGVGAFSEALRQEVTERHVRVSLVEPGAVDTELLEPQPRPRSCEAGRASASTSRSSRPRTSQTRSPTSSPAPAASR